MNESVLIFLACFVSLGLIAIVFLVKRMIWNRVRSLKVRVEFLKNKDRIEKLLQEQDKPVAKKTEVKTVVAKKSVAKKSAVKKKSKK